MARNSKGFQVLSRTTPTPRARTSRVKVGDLEYFDPVQAATAYANSMVAEFADAVEYPGDDATAPMTQVAPNQAWAAPAQTVTIPDPPPIVVIANPDPAQAQANAEILHAAAQGKPLPSSHAAPPPPPAQPAPQPKPKPAASGGLADYLPWIAGGVVVLGGGFFLLRHKVIQAVLGRRGF